MVKDAMSRVYIVMDKPDKAHKTSLGSSLWKPIGIKRHV